MKVEGGREREGNNVVSSEGEKTIVGEGWGEEGGGGGDGCERVQQRCTSFN